MINDQNILDVGLEDLPIYANIERLAIMKASKRPKLFSCSEVIDWILPKVDITKMILSNIAGQGFGAYSPTYVAQACKLPTRHSYLTEKWLKELDLEFFDCVRKMMVHAKEFRTKPSRDYETTNLRSPYWLLALMLNPILGQANGNFYKISWVPLIYFVATKGVIFNWAHIVANSLSSCISAALGGLS